jgi:hypothetical protein
MFMRADEEADQLRAELARVTAERDAMRPVVAAAAAWVDAPFAHNGMQGLVADLCDTVMAYRATQPRELEQEEES